MVAGRLPATFRIALLLGLVEIASLRHLDSFERAPVLVWHEPPLATEQWKGHDFIWLGSFQQHGLRPAIDHAPRQN